MSRFLGRRLTLGEHSFRSKQVFEQECRIGQSDALVGENFGDAVNERFGVLGFERCEQLDQSPVGHDGGKDFGVLDLAAHHHLLNAFALADVDEFAKRAERDPVTAGGKRFNFGRGFLFDADRDHFETGFPRGFEGQHGEAAIAGDHSKRHYIPRGIT
jgi:hypothetical protein